MTSDPIRVAICGALGKMGREVVKTVLNTPGLSLVSAVDAQANPEDIATTLGLGPACDVIASKDLTASLEASKAQVCVDFTHPDVVFNNTLSIIKAGTRPIIGTTGLSPEQLDEIEKHLVQKDLGGMVIPNFALGAVLMMKFAKEASQYFDHAEIIELHHNRKADAPSGTGIKTGELMLEGLQKSGKTSFIASEVEETETYPGSRGGTLPGNIHIHSVRLPGLIAHQEVLLSSQGQLLTIRHDSLDRFSFMPGVVLAIQKSMDIKGLIYGLEKVL
ncbi:MAG: 4-hydroxy-tetrahydrodipicolinate reductase [Cyanobacteria bacterium]|nr:4-hydroxy-tetrahydrodipicolinate reductase [Cyanobacteriota bacterium]